MGEARHVAKRPNSDRRIQPLINPTPPCVSLYRLGVLENIRGEQIGTDSVAKAE